MDSRQNTSVNIQINVRLESQDYALSIVGYTEVEETKLFVNTYLAPHVSYSNELDTLAEVKRMK